MAVGVNVKDVAVMDARLSGSDTSLNAPVADSETPGSDRIEFLKSEEPLPDEQVGIMIDHERRSEWIKSALDTLNPREMKIIQERRLSESGATLESLGSTLGISKERVRQIENRALEKLKSALEKDAPAITTM